MADDAPLPCPPWDGRNAADLVRVNSLDADSFTSCSGIVPESRHLFGGQVLGQAIMAGMATIDPALKPHAIHALFLGAGDAGLQVRFEVQRLRQGRSFGARQIRALQGRRILLEALVSFHVDEQGGMTHATAAPANMPDPEGLETLAQYARRTQDKLANEIVERVGIMSSVEVRPCGPLGITHGENARRRFWLRMPTAAATSDPCERTALLAYLSDFWLAAASLVGHTEEIKQQYPAMASLDHALWIHRETDPSQWMLYDMDSPFAANQIGLSRGALYDRRGELVASVMQQTLMRRT